MLVLLLTLCFGGYDNHSTDNKECGIQLHIRAQGRIKFWMHKSVAIAECNKQQECGGIWKWKVKRTNPVTKKKKTVTMYDFCKGSTVKDARTSAFEGSVVYSVVYWKNHGFGASPTAELPSPSPKCWMRMPAGCKKTLGETETPKVWFVDNHNEGNSCQKGRIHAFHKYCGVFVMHFYGPSPPEPCWIKMPTGCNKKLGETDNPKVWFEDFHNRGTSCQSARLQAFEKYCGKTDGVNFYGKKPSA